MNILITLDYELFFGSEIGTPEKCIIEPTQRLLDLVDPLGVKLCVFVDVGYLLRLKHFSADFPELNSSYDMVANQIKTMSDNGHEICLHIHPHWEDCTYDGKWNMDLHRYRLDQFSDTEIEDIVTRYKKELEEITGKEVVSYRAGGWSAQPFKRLKKAFSDNQVKIDSTVFAGGKYTSDFQQYDFENAPRNKGIWKFEDDPATEDENGSFWEVPIATHKYSPVFYWRLAMTKVMKGKNHQSFGDGYAVSNTKSQLFKLLFSFTDGVASMDGLKVIGLGKALRSYRRKGLDTFVIIGHPKAFTPFSLKVFKRFLDRTRKDKYVTYKGMNLQ